MFPSIWVVSLVALATECSTRFRPSSVAMWVADGVSWTHMRYRPMGRLRSGPRRRRDLERPRELSSDGAGAEAITGPSSRVARVGAPAWASAVDRPLPRPLPPRRPRLRELRSGASAPPGRPALRGAGLVSPTFGAGPVSPTFGAVV